MNDHTQLAPCRLCFGKFGNHDWRLCPSACETCDGYGHILGPNHPIGHIDSHPHPHVFRDVLKDSICATCNGSGLMQRHEQEIKLYRQQLEGLMASKVTP